MSERQDSDPGAELDAIVDEFVTRYHTDNPVRAEDLVDDHPEIAEELAERLAAAERMLGGGPPVSDGDDTMAHAEAHVGTPRLTPGLVIEGYDIIRMLHHGGQGIVYQAVQRSTKRAVALKLLLGGSAASTVSKRRFSREVALLVRLEHPHIVTIFDSGVTPDGIPFYVMDYVDGRPLGDHVREARLQVRSILELFQIICRAVNYAHQHAVIHRDLKPSNILVDQDGKPKLLDFGLAKAVGDAVPPSVSASHQVVGTLAYMSPEQASGSTDIDVRSDIYALGVILYEILAGRSPCAVDRSPPEVLRSIAETPSAPPSQRWSAESGVVSTEGRQGVHGGRCPIDHELDTIVLKTLAKEPDRRYQSAAALAEDIERYLRGWAIDAKRDSHWYVLRKTVHRHKAIVAIGTTAAVIVTAFAFAMTILYFDAERQRGLAEQRTREARAAEASAEAERGRADERAEELRRNVYFHSIALAQNAYEERNITQLKKLLRDCPADLRGWEWRYLWRQSDSSAATLHGHEDSVTAVACFADGTRVASASRDGSVRIWDLLTGKEVMTLLGHEGGFEALAISPEGAYIAAGGHDRTIQLWDVATGEVAGTLPGHQRTVTTLAFSPTGECLASGGQDDQLIIWDLAAHTARVTLTGHTDEVICAAFSPDGQTIVSGAADNTVRFWDKNTGAQIMVLRGHAARVTAVAFSPNGTRLLTGGWDRTIRVWDVASGEELLRLEHEDANVNAVAFSPDGEHTLSASYHSIRIWRADSGALEETLLGHESGVMTAVFSPDGDRIVSGGYDATLKIWNTHRSPDPRRLCVFDDCVDQVVVAPDGARMATAVRDGTITVWDTATSQVVAQWTSNVVNALAFAPDGQHLASAGRDGHVRVRDVATGATLLTFAAHRGWATSVAYSPDGKYLASAGSDRDIRLWLAGTGDLAATLAGHDAEVTRIAYSPAGQHLASASADRTVRIWDPASPAELRTLRGHSRTVNCVAFSPDGARLVTGSEDLTVRLWNVETGDLLHELIGHEAVVMSTTFSPDGERILSAGFDAELRIWDTRSGRLALTLSGHQGPVSSAAFSPDGLWIVSGSADQTVRIWNAPPITP